MAHFATNSLQLTDSDIVEMKQDTMLIFDACSRGALNLVPRGTSYDETSELI